MQTQAYKVEDDVGPSLVAVAESRYNHEWLIERHGHRSPAAVRVAVTDEVAA